MNYVWDEKREDILFWGSFSDLEQLNSVIGKCMAVLTESNNPREIVLETWLTLDYALRKFLLSGFELSRFCNEGFELEYILLPSSFRSLLDLFKKTVEYNKKFSLDPGPIQSDKGGGFRSSHEFWTFVHNKHPKLLEDILRVTREYQLDKNPELRDATNAGKEWAFLPFDSSVREVQKMKLGWRKQASLFDDSWFNSANHLNDARNTAAHSIDSNAVSRKLGVNGPKPLGQVRKKCKSLLNKLLAVRNEDHINAPGLGDFPDK